MYALTIILHYTIGIGILRRIGFRKSKWEVFGLAFPLGVGSATILVFLLDIAGRSLTFLSLTIVSLVLIAFLFFPEFAKIKEVKKPDVKRFWNRLKQIPLYEIVFLVVIAALFFISAWRCYYFPVKTYDSIVGIDLVAKYAVEEGQIQSRVFSEIKDELSTQPYYAPFAALSQITYMLSGVSNGKIWLSFMFLSLIVIFYGNLRREIHPLLAGLLIVILIAIPEMYPYTYLLQTDFSNAVFVCLSLVYGFYFIQKKEDQYFWVSAILFGFATWTRSETISFAVMTALLIFIFIIRDKTPQSVKYPLIFIAISFLFFALWNLYYLPLKLNYSPESYFRFGFWDFERIKLLGAGMMKVFLSAGLWGYLPYFFFVIAVINLVLFRDFKNIFLLVWIILLFGGFWVLLYHLQLNPNATIAYTFRRGTFKMWPIIIFYIGTSALFDRVSAILHKKFT